MYKQKKDKNKAQGSIYHSMWYRST